MNPRRRRINRLHRKERKAEVRLRDRLRRGVEITPEDRLAQSTYGIGAGLP